MKKNQLRGYIIAVLVLVAFNILAFLCPFARTGVFWASYVFSTLAILLQIPAFHIAFAKGETARSKFYGFPIVRISVIYLVIQLILGFVLMLAGSFLHVPAWIAVAPGVLLLAAAGIGFITADAVRDEVERQDVKTVADVSRMRKLQSKINYLVSQSKDAEVKRAVTRLSESLRYSDPVSGEAVAEQESELERWIDELESTLVDNDSSGALDICAKAEAVLAERNHLCKLNKSVK